jgi:hypothetical protein
MHGGINAWKGLMAEGAPESGISYFSSTAKAEQLIALAWWLEDGSRKFYSGVAAVIGDQEAKNLLRTSPKQRNITRPPFSISTRNSPVSTPNRDSQDRSCRPKKKEM